MTNAVEPTVALIWRHYDKIGITQGWVPERYYRLCRMLHCTVDELAALAGVDTKTIKLWIKKKRIPPVAALHFLMIERAVLLARSGVEQEPVVPVELLVK